VDTPIVQSLYLTGGRQKSRSAEEWHAYELAIILRVELSTGKIASVMEYTSPPEVCPDSEPSLMFKGATLSKDRLYVATNTEILIYTIPDFQQAGYLSHPYFNDVHHVCPTPSGALLVASTGLDMVLEVTLDGTILREWPVLQQDPWERFSRDVDYRKVETTKPHASHPNFVIHDGEQIWVSRFKQHDTICLTRPDRQVQFAGAPHDGVLWCGHMYFTTINGFVYVVDPKDGRIDACVDLNEIDERGAALGWARGIHPIDEERCWVGFSRLRPTKFAENLSWIKSGFKRKLLPTRIALYNLRTKKMLEEIDVEPFGLNAVYSIVPEPPRTGVEMSSSRLESVSAVGSGH
jgi:hypothetical protein